MRFREDRPADLKRAQEAVAFWREHHQDGTGDELVAAIGHLFRPDYAPVLRACLFRQQDGAPQATAGIPVITGEAR